jgi:hypothetical protein
MLIAKLNGIHPNRKVVVAPRDSGIDTRMEDLQGARLTTCGAATPVKQGHWIPFRACAPKARVHRDELLLSELRIDQHEPPPMQLGYTH